MIAYILCLYKKDVLRGDFEILQRGAKGAKTETWNVMWANVAQTDGRGETTG
jgi:hypothetical protein